MSTRLKRPKHKGTTALFKNPILEKLSRTHISVPLIMFTIISAACIYYGITEHKFTVLTMTLLFIAGVMVFTLIEYLVHRHVYHIKPKTPKMEKFSYTAHGVHHDYPKDKTRLAMPPLLAIVVASVFFLFYKALMGIYVYGFLAGFLMGYTGYLCVHYSVHAFKVPKNFLKILWHHHAIHHYREPNKAFGVSSPFWDVVFNTMPTKMEEITDDNH